LPTFFALFFVAIGAVTVAAGAGAIDAVFGVPPAGPKRSMCRSASAGIGGLHSGLITKASVAGTGLTRKKTARRGYIIHK